jgi:Tfp pilus assembly protein PilF
LLSLYTAIRCNPSSIDLLLIRSELYYKIGKQKKAIDGYQKALDLLPEEKGERFLQITRDLTKV